MTAPEASQRTALASEPTSVALRNRILFGILYAAARFLPVPIIDDLLREQIARLMVKVSVPAGLPKAATRPLWTDDSGCMGGCLQSLFMLPIKLLLFPVRKILTIVLGVRWVSRDLAHMLLLGRVIDHALAVGLLDAARSPDELGRQSREIRTAFETAMGGTDTRFLTALLGTAIGPIKGVVAAAIRTLRKFRRSRAEEPVVEAGEEKVLDDSVSRVERALSQPEVRKFLDEFDRRVLENLEILARRRAPIGT